ncbi:MAG: YafY family transcriptional regulator [Betaproteobacteria bacterium]|nr:YafY family transcriptional regulator [Betaproteobacteria bacterium]MBU6512382.1 YafY family transcriptional regulator [Betaproteobacteria bacterium]MDE1954370.1 YafY family transcriptional regulator [Betaproteobacteria bacterium]MDE2152351.1 YafY family transcriptional regulator [Betaproteobacteria bacterium]MDE2477920.1 YafY family transcriptional regulator [Betaproteobacteria bacterium]
MSRAERLLQLLQILRRHRVPVTAAVLAADAGVSLRTLYRDVAALRAQGACIEGEAGVGYQLRPGFVLPPLMFSAEEIEALVLGVRWVAGRADAALAAAARDALAKVEAVLPPPLRLELQSASALVGPGSVVDGGNAELARIRGAIRGERKVDLRYRDEDGRESTRTVWPFAVGYFDHVRMLAAWCELRADFRHFRTDRIVGLNIRDERYPRRRQALLREWRERRGEQRPK